MSIEFDSASLTGLTDVHEGRFVVRTSTSEYLLDLDDRLAQRLPGEVLDGFETACLRRDGQEFHLDTLVSCQLGQPMVLLAANISDVAGVLTLRQTTPVVHIERVVY